MSESDITEPKIETISLGLKEIEKTGNILSSYRKKPLLLMYYSDKCSSIEEGDLEYLEIVLQTLQKIPELDLLIHTRGGDVSASYFLAQIIRSKCEKLRAIVPTHAYSGGTTMTLAADMIEMNTTSKISPIDIQFGGIESEEKLIPLLNFDKYIEFIDASTRSFELEEEENRSKIIADIMVKLCDTIHPFDAGELFRLRSLHELYAKVLLLNYMFRNDSDKLDKADIVVKNLTTGSPSHDFDIDINIARSFGLKVDTMDDMTYKLSKKLIQRCVKEEANGVLCPFIGSDHKKRLPFFHLFITNLNGTNQNIDGDLNERS